MLNDLTDTLKKTKLPVFRDLAPKNTKYPYIVYSFVSKERKMASGLAYKRLTEYQISLFTEGTEKDLTVLETVLDDADIRYRSFSSFEVLENQNNVTNFFTFIKVVENGR